RIAAQRIEAGVDLEPSRREEVRNLKQRLEPVERLLGLADADVDQGELVLVEGRVQLVLRQRLELDGALALANRLLLAAEQREDQAQLAVALRLPGRRRDLRRERLRGLLRVSPHVRRVAAAGVLLREALRPVTLVVVEGARREAQEEIALRPVEDPPQGVVARERRDE